MQKEKKEKEKEEKQEVEEDEEGEEQKRRRKNRRKGRRGKFVRIFTSEHFGLRDFHQKVQTRNTWLPGGRGHSNTTTGSDSSWAAGSDVCP